MKGTEYLSHHCPGLRGTVWIVLMLSAIPWAYTDAADTKAGTAIEMEVANTASSILQSTTPAPVSIKDSPTDTIQGKRAESPLPAYGLDSDAQQALIQKRNWVENFQNTAFRRDLYSTNPLPVPSMMMTQHLTQYCSSPSEGENCPSDPLLTLGDVKLSSILGGSGYDTARDQAAQAFMSTLLSPVDNTMGVSNFQDRRPIDALTLTNDPNLLQKYAQALSDEALLSVIRYPFAVMMAKRTIPSVSGANTTLSLSEMQLMENTALQRQMSSDWQKNVVNLTPDQVQQELLRIAAADLFMKQQSYQQMERVEALLALLNLQTLRQYKVGADVMERTKTTALPFSTGTSTGGN